MNDAQETPRFLKACRREEVDSTPVWFMRQAGRYMAEYRRLREKYSMLELCRTPELAAEVTLQPIDRFDLDAAILFADILLPLPGIGVEFGFEKGEGPKIYRPVRSPEQVKGLKILDAEESLGFVAETLSIVREKLDPRVTLIGFAGAPFTLASYMIEGGYSRNFLHTKEMMYQREESWHRLMKILADSTVRYLEMQVEAGAQALQLFDSWIGALGPEDYEQYVMPHTRSIFERLQHLSVPTIHFGTGTAGFLERMRDAGGSVQGVDWRIELGRAWERIGPEYAVQGNLDPLAMMAPKGVLERKVRKVLEEADGRRGHIFNLGHGFLPQTPVENVEAVISWVHEYSRRR